MIKNISNKLLLSIGATASALFIAGLLITNNVKNDLIESALEDTRLSSINIFKELEREKLSAGVSAAVSIAGSQSVKTNIALQDHEELANILNEIRSDFAQNTENKNIHFLVIDNESKILLRTYVKEPDPSRGKDVSYRTGVTDLLSGKKKYHSGAYLSSAGLILSSMVPVVAKGKPVGVLEFRDGFRSISEKMSHNNFHHITLLDEKAFSLFTKGKENKQIGGYHLTNNKEFSQENQDWYSQLPIGDILAKGFWTADGKTVSVIPVQNSKDETIASHLIGFDNSILASRVEQIDSIAYILEGIMLIMVLGIMLVVWISVKRQVAKPLANMQEQIDMVAKTGRFDTQLSNNKDDEVAQIAKSINGLMSMLSTSFSGVNTVLTQVAQGDFTQRIHAQLPGDLEVLKSNVNNAVTVLEGNMKGLSKAMMALESGHFDYRMDESVEKSLRVQVDGAMKTLQQTLGEINGIMQSVANGDFSNLVTIDAKGDLDQLKRNINDTVNALKESMNALAHATSELAQGNLTTRMTGNYQGELKRIANAFNDGVDGLNQSFGKIIETVNVLEVAADEVVSNSTLISDKTTSQSVAIEQTSRSIVDMTDGIKRSATNAEQARALASQTQSAAQEGVALMDQTVVAMQEIAQSSNKISSIVSLVESIAFQTNLLALNAAVEAARAGEHGRGFAVVASEVRALAGKSSDAANEIKQLVDQTVAKASAGDELVIKTVSAFADIQNKLTQTDESIASIAQAMSNQRDEVLRVNNTVVTLERDTKQNASLVDEASDSAKTMQSRAKQVKELIAHFRT